MLKLKELKAQNPFEKRYRKQDIKYRRIAEEIYAEEAWDEGLEFCYNKMIAEGYRQIPSEKRIIEQLQGMHSHYVEMLKLIGGLELLGI